jgi:hypothetical protein
LHWKATAADARMAMIDDATNRRYEENMEALFFMKRLW